MWKDPIVEEIRRNWSEYARKFHYSLPAIFADLKEREKRSGQAKIYTQSRRRTLRAVAEDRSPYGKLQP